MPVREVVFRDGELAARLSATPSLLFAILGGLAAAAVLVFLVRRALRHRAWAAEARAAMTQAQGRALQPGVHVLAGRVQTEGDLPAIRVRIREVGREWRTKNGLRHRWSEVHRDVDAQPFELITSAGTVRVEPDATVKLVDTMATVRRPGQQMREREASLDPGEHVFVSGLVQKRRRGEGAFRGGDAATWVMRAPEGGALVCSTEPLSEPHERWYRFHRSAALLAAIPALVLLAFLALGYFPLALGGVVVEGEVVHLEHRVNQTRNRRYESFVVEAVATLPDGRRVELEDRLRRKAWTQLELGDRLPFVVLPSRPEVHQVERRPGIHVSVPLLATFVAFGSGLGFAVARRRRRAWWEQDKVVTEGSGPLEASF